MGRVAFWLSWPLLYIYLYYSKRTRVLVVAGEDVLITKGWLGSGRWNLPGGGLHWREDPAKGATRELREETGIAVLPAQLQFLFSGRAKREHGLRFWLYAYVLLLDKKPKLSRSALELTHMTWINWRTLYNDPRTAQNIKDILAAWFRP